MRHIFLDYEKRRRQDNLRFIAILAAVFLALMLLWSWCFYQGLKGAGELQELKGATMMCLPAQPEPAPVVVFPMPMREEADRPLRIFL